MKKSDIFWNSILITVLIILAFSAIIAIGLIVFSDIVFIIFTIFGLTYILISFLSLFKYFSKFVPNYIQKFNQYLNK